MAGIRWPPEDSDLVISRHPTTSATTTAAGGGDLVSDDDRSVAADSWSIKSEYGSTLDDEQRHVDASEVLSGANFRAASDYSSDKDEPDVNEIESSMLGLQSYWDASYAEDLANYHEHGQAGEIWFGAEVMDTVASWTRNLCLNMFQRPNAAEGSNCKSENRDNVKDLSNWSVLDIGTGNGLLLHELAKQGFCELTGTDYSEGAIELSRNIAIRDGFPNINFLVNTNVLEDEKSFLQITRRSRVFFHLGRMMRTSKRCSRQKNQYAQGCVKLQLFEVDDILETKLDRKFQLVMDKGTLDAIGLHPDGPLKRIMYWESVKNLVAPGGILVITSCNNTKNELLREVDSFNQRSIVSRNLEIEEGSEQAVFKYIDHIRTYPTIMFGGVEGSRVSTVAFLRN